MGIKSFFAAPEYMAKALRPCSCGSMSYDTPITFSSFANCSVCGALYVVHAYVSEPRVKVVERNEDH